jgi:hypothetical protein
MEWDGMAFWEGNWKGHGHMMGIWDGVGLGYTNDVLIGVMNV